MITTEQKRLIEAAILENIALEKRKDEAEEAFEKSEYRVSKVLDIAHEDAYQALIALSKKLTPEDRDRIGHLVLTYEDALDVPEAERYWNAENGCFRESTA